MYVIIFNAINFDSGINLKPKWKTTRDFTLHENWIELFFIQIIYIDLNLINIFENCSYPIRILFVQDEAKMLVIGQNLIKFL